MYGFFEVSYLLASNLLYIMNDGNKNTQVWVWIVVVIVVIGGIWWFVSSSSGSSTAATQTQPTNTTGISASTTSSY